MFRAWLAVSGIIWPNWRVFNTPGPGPGPALVELRLYLLATHRGLASQPWRQGLPSIPCRPRRSALFPSPSPHLQSQGAGWGSAAVRRRQPHGLCLLHVLHSLQEGPIPKGKEAAEFHLWDRKWVSDQSKAQSCIYAGVWFMTTAVQQAKR